MSNPEQLKAFYLYLSLDCQRRLLWLNGKEDSPEDDAICDQMDGPWRELKELEPHIKLISSLMNKADKGLRP